MNRNLFNLKTAGLVVLGLFLMVGVATLTFAFKAEITTEKVDNTEQWYALNPTGDVDYADQDITGYSDIPEPTSGTECAQIGNSGEFCAILLRFPNTDPAPDLENTTVEAALLNGAIIIDGEATGGYALMPD